MQAKKIAIIGEPHSGKSLLVNCLAKNYVSPTSYKITSGTTIPKLYLLRNNGTEENSNIISAMCDKVTAEDDKQRSSFLANTSATCNLSSDEYVIDSKYKTFPIKANNNFDIVDFPGLDALNYETIKNNIRDFDIIIFVTTRKTCINKTTRAFSFVYKKMINNIVSKSSQNDDNHNKHFFIVISDNKDTFSTSSDKNSNNESEIKEVKYISSEYGVNKENIFLVNMRKLFIFSLPEKIFLSTTCFANECGLIKKRINGTKFVKIIQGTKTKEEIFGENIISLAKKENGDYNGLLERLNEVGNKESILRLYKKCVEKDISAEECISIFNDNTSFVNSLLTKEQIYQLISICYSCQNEKCYGFFDELNYDNEYELAKKIIKLTIEEYLILEELYFQEYTAIQSMLPKKWKRAITLFKLTRHTFSTQKNTNLGEILFSFNENEKIEKVKITSNISGLLNFVANNKEKEKIIVEYSSDNSSSEDDSAKSNNSLPLSTDSTIITIEKIKKDEQESIIQKYINEDLATVSSSKEDIIPISTEPKIKKGEACKDLAWKLSCEPDHELNKLLDTLFMNAKNIKRVEMKKHFDYANPVRSEDKIFAGTFTDTLVKYSVKQKNPKAKIKIKLYIPDDDTISLLTPTEMIVYEKISAGFKRCRINLATIEDIYYISLTHHIKTNNFSSLKEWIKKITEYDSQLSQEKVFNFEKRKYLSYAESQANEIISSNDGWNNYIYSDFNLKCPKTLIKGVTDLLFVNYRRKQCTIVEIKYIKKINRAAWLQLLLYSLIYYSQQKIKTKRLSIYSMKESVRESLTIDDSFDYEKYINLIHDKKNES